MPPPASAGPGVAALRQPNAPPWAVAAILRLSGATYRRTQPVPPAPQQVLHAIEAGRTAPRGGHADHWPPCGGERYASKAWRNRPGPQGPTLTKAPWGADRQAAGLPVPYFPLVLTVPHVLTPRIRAHQRPR
jgi:hypothetical protein